MYIWIVYLHIVVIFVFLIQHAAEIWVAFKLRGQPEGIFATYGFMPSNNVRNLRITYSLIILTGITAGFTSTWWRQGWLLAALAMMLVIWIVMKRVSNIYLYAVDAIAERALNNREDASAIDEFKSELKARREPEILSVTSALGGLIILSLMMFEPI